MASTLILFIEWRRGGSTMTSFKAAWTQWPTYVVPTLTLLILWLCLFGWSVIRTVYGDHILLAHTNSNLVAELHKPLPLCPVAPRSAPCPKAPRGHSVVMQGGPGSVVTSNQSGGTNVGTLINEADPPRHLTPKEVTDLSAAGDKICPSLPKFGVTASGANAEAQRYAAEIVGVLNRHGCTAMFGLPIPSLEATVVGVVIGVSDLKNIPREAFYLQRIFAAAGMNAVIHPKGPIFYAEDSFVLAVGAKD